MGKDIIKVTKKTRVTDLVKQSNIILCFNFFFYFTLYFNSGLYKLNCNWALYGI